MSRNVLGPFTTYWQHSSVVPTKACSISTPYLSPCVQHNFVGVAYVFCTMEKHLLIQSVLGDKIIRYHSIVIAALLWLNAMCLSYIVAVLYHYRLVHDVCLCMPMYAYVHPDNTVTYSCHNFHSIFFILKSNFKISCTDIHKYVQRVMDTLSEWCLRFNSVVRGVSDGKCYFAHLNHLILWHSPIRTLTHTHAHPYSRSFNIPLQPN